MVLILSLIELAPLPETRQLMLELLRFSAERVQAKPGCLGCGAYDDTSADHHVLYIEQWETEEQMQQHIKSPLYLSVLNAIDLGMEVPKVSFHRISKTMSMELIESLRTSELA